jgi:hypothetical protein
MGQNQKSSTRANVFRFGPESGHLATEPAYPFRDNKKHYPFPTGCRQGSWARHAGQNLPMS